MALITQALFLAVCIFVFPSPSKAYYYSTRGNDGSYQFSFGADDHTRDEVGDLSGNVVGSYRYIADDNHEREVNYNAGPGLGFQATGEGILDVPALIDEIRAYRGPWVEPDYPAHWDNLPRAYNFNYHAGDSARKEVSDDSGHRYGYYTYLDDEGNQQIVHYEAGIGGYRVLGNNLPEGISSQFVTARDSAPSLQHVSRPRSSHVDPSNLKVSYGGDGSYAFDYDAAGHSRSESGDAAGNVGGSFSYRGDDNANYNVDYTAGSGRGFQASGAHLPTSTSGGHVSGRVSATYTTRPRTLVSKVRKQQITGGRRLHQQSADFRRTQTSGGHRAHNHGANFRRKQTTGGHSLYNQGTNFRRTYTSGGHRINQNRVGVHQPFSVGIGGNRLYDYSTTHSGYSGPGSFYYERRPASGYSYQLGTPQSNRYITTSGPSHSYNYHTSSHGTSLPYHRSYDNYNSLGSGYSQLFPGYSSVSLPGGVGYSTGGLRHYRSASDEIGDVSASSFSEESVEG